MKPTFALDLSRDAIALLHRTPKGWLAIGEVAFDAPDMAEALDYLRRTALGLSPLGMACKVILPNSQILYTEVEAPGPSRNEKRRQIADALEGRTPYATDDLVFDWSGKGTTVKVAVIARETLAEAEGFALAHRLNPVSFVAIPESGSFVGEPWFGPTAAAEALLAPGESVDRDREPVTILLRELPSANPAPEPVAAAEALAQAEDLAPTEAAAADGGDDDASLTGLDEALNAALAEEMPAAAGPAVLQDPPLADLQPSGSANLFDLPAEAQPSPAQFPEPLPAPGGEGPSLAAESTGLSDAALAAALAPIDTAPAVPEVEEAPFAHVTDTSAFPDDDGAAPLTNGAGSAAAAQVPDDDVPPSPPSAAIAAFASRRAASAADAGAMPGGGTAFSAEAAAKVQDSARARLGGQPVARPIAPVKGGSAGLVTAPSIPGTRPKVKVRTGLGDLAAAAKGGADTVRSPARPGGTFGTAAPKKKRSGAAVFLVLIALLLLFLALIAGWSSFFLSRNGQTEVETGLVLPGDSDIPAVDDEMLADMQDPEGMTGPLPEADLGRVGDAASLATESLPVNTGEAAILAEPDAVAVDDAASGADPLPVAAAPADSLPSPQGEDAADSAQTIAAAPEPAPGTVVTTEVAATQAPVEDQDEIFLSAMDAPPPALDALALPVPEAVTDAAPGAPMPPPAFGTVYQFDAAGLLKPTADGILSPDGVMLIAGQPPRLPPPRSDAATAAALAATPPAADIAAAETALAASDAAAASLVTGGVAAAPVAEAAAPSDPAMAGFRPRPRPEGLAPATDDDDAALTDAAATEFAGLRPLARPESVVVAASASRAAQPAAESPAEATVADLGAAGASLAAQAEAQLAAAAALEAANPWVVAISKRPQGRPRDLSRAVEAAVAAAVRAPEPAPEATPEPEAKIVAAAAAPPPDLKPEELDEVDEPETSKSAPKIPTKASVAKQATFKNAINLSKINLIGTYGTDSKRYALVRQSNGRYKKVKVGDRIDGGTVKAITETEVRYQKGGKLLTLKMPKV